MSRLGDYFEVVAHACCVPRTSRREEGNDICVKSHALRLRPVSRFPNVVLPRTAQATLFLPVESTAARREQAFPSSSAHHFWLSYNPPYERGAKGGRGEPTRAVFQTEDPFDFHGSRGAARYDDKQCPIEGAGGSASREEGGRRGVTGAKGPERRRGGSGPYFTGI